MGSFSQVWINNGPEIPYKVLKSYEFWHCIFKTIFARYHSFPPFRYSKLVCISYALRIAKQDASVELPKSSKLTTCLPVCYFLPLDKPYILLTTATAKEEISKHWLKRWEKKSLRKFFLEIRIFFLKKN